MEKIFNPGIVIPALLLLEIPIFIWMFVDMWRMIRPNGALKRGIPVWRERLEPSLVKKLETITDNQIVMRDSFFGPVATSFILVDGSQRLVNPDRKRWSTSWPAVGYININNKPHVLEYRLSLPGLLSLIPFFLFLIGFLIIGINIWVERKFILEIIRKI